MQRVAAAVVRAGDVGAEGERLRDDALVATLRRVHEQRASLRVGLIHPRQREAAQVAQHLCGCAEMERREACTHTYGVTDTVSGA